MKKKAKILIALSGGVDSAVAAAVLVRAGFDVTAAYMLNYDNNQPGSESCWLPDYRDAVRVAAHLGIPILKFDFIKEYKEKVLDYMFREYQNGRTPNPDVLCNKYVKFGVWLEKAQELGFDFLATGHYARVKKTRRGFLLREAKDTNKDQTYFLHQLSQEQLSRTMFPVGDYTKPQVRKLAKKFKLPVAEKEESMGICFVGEVPMEQFLSEHIKSKSGKIVLSNGAVLGNHTGLSFYTIGQRHMSVKTDDNKPLYVVAKRVETNELVVGYEDEPLLYCTKTMLEGIHWIAGQAPSFPLKCQVRLRHRQALQKCVVNADNTVVFSKPERAVTPGQFAVFYKNGECLGGGIVK